MSKITRLLTSKPMALLTALLLALSMMAPALIHSRPNRAWAAPGYIEAVPLDFGSGMFFDNVTHNQMAVSSNAIYTFGMPNTIIAYNYDDSVDHSETITTSAPVTQMAATAGNLYYRVGSNVFSPTQATPAVPVVSDVANIATTIDGGNLFFTTNAATGDGYSIYERMSIGSHRYVLTSNTPIVAFAPNTNATYYIAHDDSWQLVIHRQGASIVPSFSLNYGTPIIRMLNHRVAGTSTIFVLRHSILDILRPDHPDINQRHIALNQFRGVDIAISGGNLYIIEQGSGIFRFPLGDDGLPPLTPGGTALDLTHRYVNQLVGTHGSVLGSFHTPGAASIGADMIVVPDTNNNRVFVARDNTPANGSTRYLLEGAWSAPTHSAIDRDGYIAIASDTALTILDQDYSVVAIHNIDDINSLVFFDATLLVSHSSNITTITGSNFDTIATRPIRAHAIAAHRLHGGFVYMSPTGSFYSLSGSLIGNLPSTITAPIIDFDIDDEGTFWMLTANRIFAVSADFDSYRYFDFRPTPRTRPLGATSMIIANTSVPAHNVGLGDLIITDTAGHTVRVVNGFGNNGPVRQDNFGEHDRDQTPYGYGLIRRTLKERTPLKSSPIAARGFVDIVAPNFDIGEGARVVVIEWRPHPIFDYAYVAAIDTEHSANGRVVSGYMRHSHLSAAELLSPPRFRTGTTRYTTHAYRLPLGRQETAGVRRIEPYVAQGTSVRLLNFVTAFTDTLDVRWVMVTDFDEYNTVGFMRFDDIIPDAIDENIPLPNYNARINAPYRPNGVTAYLRDSQGRQTPSGIMLEHDRRVEVVGAFDPTIQYTRIRIYIPGYFSQEFFVQTQYIDYQYFNVLQGVALGVTAGGAAVGSVLVGGRLKRRRSL